MSGFDFTSEEKPKLESVVNKIEEISTLPQVSQQILKVIADPIAGAEDLQKILKADPALTSKILKMANSAYFSLREKVDNVKKAIVFLGFSSVKNLAMASSVCDLFKSKKSINGYTREELWKHSVVVALCAKSIALRAGLKVGEDIFTAGIMHDIGIIMEDQYLHDGFVKVLSDPSLKELDFINAEQSIFGFDHTTLGAHVAEQWKIPEQIAIIIGNHHYPRRAPEQFRESTAIVYLANIISKAKKIGFSSKTEIKKTDFMWAMEVLNFKNEDVSLIAEELPQEMEKAQELLIL